MMVLKRAAFILAATVFCSSMSQAQGNIAFGGLSHDSTLPVEITADQLQVDQTDGSALFKGNVVAGQGDMRLSANEMKVEYSSGDAESTGRIQRIVATGDVLLVNGAEAAEAQSAIYTIDSGNVVLSGDVILTQGQNALSSNRMVIDLGSGTAQMEGRVRTILQPGGEQ